MPVHVADGEPDVGEQPLVKAGGVSEGGREGSLRRRAEQREQPAAAVGRRPHEQRAQLVKAVLTLAEVRERVEQLAEIRADAKQHMPIGVAGVQVREQQLIPLTGQDRRLAGLPPCNGPLHTRDSRVEWLPEFSSLSDQGAGETSERPAAGEP
ncbi:hypothetical protein [Streptomyces nogalater]|uniref:Uncharacterized protein n=1 Tax=Streptomyces nogalater TaxID=38314 RepID=A0ABW0WDF9_STRNO